MNTTATTITIDLNDNRTGNLLAMTDAVTPNLGMYDTIYGLVLPNTGFIGIEIEGGSLQPMNSPIHSRMMRKLLLKDVGSNRKLVMDYNSQTGQYEISVNDFAVSELSKLTIEVHRIDFNRIPRPVAA